MGETYARSSRPFERRVGCQRATPVQALPTSRPSVAGQINGHADRPGTLIGVENEKGRKWSEKLAARKSGLVKIGRGAVVVVVSTGAGGASTGAAISSTGGG